MSQGPSAAGEAAWMKIVLAAVVSLLAWTEEDDGGRVGGGHEGGPRGPTAARPRHERGNDQGRDPAAEAGHLPAVERAGLYRRSPGREERGRGHQLEAADEERMAAVGSIHG
jgi:hypothetical protein